MESSITSIITEIENRQENLVPDFSGISALVAGLGGIGNWIAVDLALIGTGTLILFDPDKVEPSNLNRTLFRLSDIGKYKTKAVKELIMERRKDMIVITGEEYFTVEHLKKKITGVDYIFDCTDSTKLMNSIAGALKRNEKFILPPYVKLGYDGFEGTLCINDFESGRWGQDSGYVTVPSFFGTPQILSAAGIIELMLNKNPSKIVNLNVKKLITQISN